MMTKMRLSCVSKRWIFALAGAFVCAAHYSFRTNMSVAILCMVKSKDGHTIASEVLGDNSSLKSGFDETDSTPRHGEFDWDKETQSYILAAYFYGLVLLQIPGGVIVSKYGGRKSAGFALGLVSLLSLCTSLAARWSFGALIVLRFLQGAAAGVIAPGVYGMAGIWCPTRELSRMMSFIFVGNYVGQVSTWSGAGILCRHGFDNGWGSIFHITGGMGLLAAIFWIWATADSPSEHRSISEREREYILQNTTIKANRSFKLPWLDIIKSRAMWACLVGHIVFLWLYCLFQLELPSYMEEVLQFDIKENGLLSSVPEIFIAIAGVCVSHAADSIGSKYLSVTNTRKLIQGVSFLGAGALLIGAGFVGRDCRILAVVLMTLTGGFIGFGLVGVVINHLDFAPAYAGVLYAITNSFGSVCGIVVPILSAKLTHHDKQAEWRNVFYISAAFSLFGAIIFFWFSSGVVEHWAKEDKEIKIESEATKVLTNGKETTYSTISYSIEE